MSIKDEVLKALNYLRLSSNPVGTIIWYIGSDVPEGYLLCNGAEISRTDYARLFAVLGVKCGAGNGTTTFNLPDFNGRVPQATSDPSKVGQKLESQLPNISGALHAPGSVAGSFFHDIEPNGKIRWDSLGTLPISWAGFDASKADARYSSDKLQPNALQLLACIRT